MKFHLFLQGDARRAAWTAPVLSFLLLAAAWAPATAQTGTERPSPSQPPAPAADPGAIELAEEPFELDEIGLTMHLPAEATAQSTRIGGRTSVQIVPRGSTWIINIQTPQTSNPEATVREAADQTVALLQGSVGVLDPDGTKVLETDARLLERTDNLVINGLACERLYVSLPSAVNIRERGQGQRLIKGYTIFKPAPRQFVVFELIALESEFPQARRVYETTLATVSFLGPDVLGAERGAAVKAGVAFFNGLTAEQYREAMKAGSGGSGEERWERLYRPAPSGSPQDAEELGYRSLKFWQGQRGEINPNRARNAWSKAEEEEGYITRLAARQLNGQQVIDTEGLFFVSLDRKQEAWSIRMAIRTGKKDPEVWTETGIRIGDDMKVAVERGSASPREMAPFVPAEGYLSQCEAYLMPYLLVRAGLEGEFGFYTYRAATENIALRRDVLARDPAAGGAWTLTTRFREDIPPQRSIFNERGEVVRTELGDGRLWEPADPTNLFRLWKQKGLPTGTPGR